MSSKNVICVAIFAALICVGCSGEQVTDESLRAIPDATKSSMSAEAAPGQAEDNFFPLQNIVPRGNKIEAQNLLEEEGGRQYRQLLSIDGDAEAYVSLFEANAAAEGFAISKSNDARWEFVKGQHVIVLKILQPSEQGGSAKAHVVWTVK